MTDRVTASDLGRGQARRAAEGLLSRDERNRAALARVKRATGQPLTDEEVELLQKLTRKAQTTDDANREPI